MGIFAWAGPSGLSWPRKGRGRVLGGFWAWWAGSGDRFPLFVGLLTKCIFIRTLGQFPSLLGGKCGRELAVGVPVGVGRGVAVLWAGFGHGGRGLVGVLTCLLSYF